MIIIILLLLRSLLDVKEHMTALQQPDPTVAIGALPGSIVWTENETCGY